MYEAKYSKYITQNKSRFATAEEIKDVCVPIGKEDGYNGCGAPLYYDGHRMYVDSSDAHYYIQGQTGCKKSRVIETNVIKSIIEAGENLIVNDPKGEAYKRTAPNARSNGYEVFVLNLRDVENSNGWNPLSFPYSQYQSGNIAEAEQAVNDIVDIIMSPSRQTANDIYWPENAGMALLYCIELLMASVPREFFNMSNVIQLTNESNASTLRSILNKMDQNSNVAIAMHAILDLQAEKTSSCIYSTLKQALKPFLQNRSLLELLCKDDIHYEDLVKRKTAIYIIYPDEKKSLSFLISLFFTQCYQYLISYSARFVDSRLPIRVNFVLDEFSNLPAVDNFENCISEARGHNVRYFLFSQAFGQLKTKYKDNADTVIANCDWIIFPSKDYSFLETITKMCGKEYDYYGVEHNLIDCCEMQHLKKYTDGAEALILKTGQYPFVTKLPDFEYVEMLPIYPPDPVRFSSKSQPQFITFSEWVNGIGKVFNYPFPAK